MGLFTGTNQITATLGQIATTAKSSTINPNSIRAGLHSYANGVYAYAKSFGAIANGLSDFGDFFGGVADATARSRRAVAENDSRAVAQANEYRQICEKEGVDSENAKNAYNRLLSIQGQRSMLGFFSFGDNGPNPVQLKDCNIFEVK